MNSCFSCIVAILKVQSKISLKSHVRVNISSRNKPVASISIFCDSPFELCLEFKIWKSPKWLIWSSSCLVVKLEVNTYFFYYSRYRQVHTCMLVDSECVLLNSICTDEKYLGFDLGVFSKMMIYFCGVVHWWSINITYMHSRVHWFGLFWGNGECWPVNGSKF